MKQAYLITAVMQDGDHEHRHFAIVRATNPFEAATKAAKSMPRDKDGLDKRNSKWGFGDNMTSTLLHGIKPLAENQAELLQNLGVAHTL